MSGSHCRRAIAAAAMTAVCCSAAGLRAQETPAPPPSHARDASMEEYRQHLAELSAVVEACAKARDAAHCDAALAGDDDRVAAGAGEQRRLVRYNWLRVLLNRAKEADAAHTAPGAAKNDAEETTTDLLREAKGRLAADMEQTPAGTAAHAAERTQLKQVLAGKEFRDLKRPPEKDTWDERFARWLNRVFAGLGRLQARSAWVGRAVVWGFVLAVGVGLVWVLLRMERRWRVQLVPDMDAPAAGAASARDWQLWMADARAAAAQERWREAIHFLYWASISRLESKKLWPADRARTPREYLELLRPDDARRGSLRALTALFERTWYGGREASALDYRSGEEIATALMGGAHQPGHAAKPAVAEGGAA